MGRALRCGQGPAGSEGQAKDVCDGLEVDDGKVAA